MRIRLFAVGALLGAITTIGFSQMITQVQTLGPADQSAMTHFTVHLPLTHRQIWRNSWRQTDKKSPSYHQWLTPAQFKAQFGPSRADVAEAKLLTGSAGFTVVGEKTQNLEVEGLCRL